ncbi:uncharacterized protein knl1 isoform X2 [Betta splendens]|uniref:Uncharacterized protein knl1 isoform X2 n=1 Tax=Betta splendens TaxID=158456 RepID=A0A6P7LTP3_BETSP|nr:uncharacterized protein knl1 isoform X2 [Betta splendens]
MPATAAATNRIHVPVTEDGIQPIMGMDTLLNAPLHVSQQRDRVNFDMRQDYGEKTTDDIFLDMTQSHTVNIASNVDGLTSRERALMKTAGSEFMGVCESESQPSDRNMGLSREQETQSSSVPGLDQEFQTLLASFSRSSAPPQTQIKVQTNDVGKENMVCFPKSASVMDKPFLPRRTGQPFYESALFPEDGVSRDVPEDCVQASSVDDYDFFQSLFPTQRIFSEKRISQTFEIKSKQQQSSKALSSSDPKDMTSMKNFVLHVSHQKDKSEAGTDWRQRTIQFSATDAAMDMTEVHTVNIDIPFIEEKQQNVNPSPAGGEKTVRFSALDAAMDMTEVHPVNFDTAFNPEKQLNKNQSPAGGEKTVRFSALDAAMDMTEVHPVNIDIPFNEEKQQNVNPSPAGGEKTVRFSALDAAMDMTEVHPVNFDTAFNPEKQLNKNQSPAGGEKTVQFSALDAAMDMTEVHPVNIDIPFNEEKQQNVNPSPAGGEKTVQFSALDAAMDMTEVHPVNIDIPFNEKKLQNVNPSPAGGEKTVRFSALDAAMDMTEVHPVNIDISFNEKKLQNVNPSPAGGEKTVRFTALDADMDMTEVHPVNIDTAFNTQKQVNMNPSPAGGEKTVQFSALDAAMDMTEVHPVNIDTAFNPPKQVNMNPSPAGGEKTVQFSALDAAMDMTEVHPVNIDTAFNTQKQVNMNPSPAGEAKTVQFSALDAAMDMTEFHPVNIDTAFNPQKQVNMNPSPAGEAKTVRFSAINAAKDETQVHTVNFDIAFNPPKQLNVNPSPAGGEKTVRFTALDAAMDVTQVHTVKISAVFDPQIHQTVYRLPSPLVPKTHQNDDKIAYSVDSADPMMNVTEAHTGHIKSHPVLDTVHLEQDPIGIFTRRKMDFPLTNKKSNATAAFAQFLREGVDTNANVDQREEQQCNVNTEKKGPGFAQCTTEKPENEALTHYLADDVRRDKTVVETHSILEPACTEDHFQCLPSKHDLYPTSDHLIATEVNMLQSNGEPSSDGLEILNYSDSVHSNEAPKKTNQSSLVLQTARAPSAAEQHNSKSHLENSRWKDLTDLQVKIRRLSHLVNESPGTFVDSCTVPVTQMEYEEDKTSIDKATSLPVVEREMDVDDVEDRTQAQCLEEEELASAAVTPFNLKTKQLMARLSVGGFKPKLPQRSKSDDPKKADSSGAHIKTITGSVTSHLSNFDHDVSNIFDEELGSCDDMSETLDTSALQQISDKVCSSQELNMDQPVEDWGLEWESISAPHVQKRPLPEAKINIGHEKRVKTFPEASFDNSDRLQSGTEAQACVPKNYGQVTTAPTETSQTADFSNSSHTASIRREATFESTFKHSIFESQLEDYDNNVKRKLDDGTITMSEFFKLFNIDFVIHNPRQSVFPATDLLNTDRTPFDLLKDRHINLPKQRVYEADVFNLTEKVERMNMRTRDLKKPLKLFNRSLWEEMRGLSEEELKLFGVKLKERNNYFRKLSKTNSHEMKEVLYSNLLQANMEEQQTLRGTIKKADEMIKSLDDCIHDLEAELAAVENGSDCRPGLRFYEEELKKVTGALTESERQVSELEMQKKQKLDDLNRVKAEAEKLEDNISMLHLINEWKLGNKGDNCTTYTFLFDTMYLNVLYEKSNGQTAGNEQEQKILDITFKFLLDDAKSEFNARLVHKLLSQYIEEQPAWVTKYPTHGHVPQLLHDLSLVVGRCRLLGEELRLLQMWGSLKLDILDISSVDTQVCIVFSSLRRFSKFEVVFSVCLVNRLYVLQLQSFTNTLGDATKQQVEEIVASISPGKKLLTKVVKKIHETLLC